ncbi:MAG TPA: flagellar type III secretion system protein FlhB [Burkholderiaceae bacterium]|nr:flagellar type III secretion system protein FlhB [Burkholderiaceae bacterium]
MSEDVSREDRNLPASQRRLDQARERGDVARSRDLGHAAGLMAGFGLIAATSPWLLEAGLGIVRGGLTFNSRDTHVTHAMLERFAALGATGVVVTLIAATALLLVAVAASIALGGFVFAPTRVAPDLSRIDPLTGMTKHWSLTSMAETGKLALVACVLAIVAGIYLKLRGEQFVAALALPLPAALSTTGSIILTGCLTLAGVMVVVAGLDVPLQLWRHHSNLRMTLEEVKREAKESEGDPHVKGRIRQLQRERASKRMLAAVPTADVVVTNPTHYAVALKYDDATMRAPRVVAKGADVLAQKIREAADAAGVPRLEAPPLARALYAHAEVDREIPVALYTAVAQVLAWVFQLRAALPGRAQQSAPSVDVPPELDPHSTQRGG